MIPKFKRRPKHPDHDRIEAWGMKRKYAVEYRWGDLPWLVWTKDVERTHTYPLDRLFKPFRLFRYSPKDPFPLLRLYTPPDRFPDSSAVFMQGAEVYRQKRGRFTEEYGDELHLALPELNAVLSGIYDLLDRIEPRLFEPLMGGRRVIEAWVVETERALIEGESEAVLERIKAEAERRYRHNIRAGQRGMGLSPEEAERIARSMRDDHLVRASQYGGAGELYEKAKLVWDCFSLGGVDEEGLRQLFARECKRLHTPPLVAEAQSSGLLFYYEDIASIHAEVWQLNEKRTMYEAIRHAILVDEPLPTAEEYAEKYAEKQERVHGNSKAMDARSEIVLDYWAVKRHSDERFSSLSTEKILSAVIVYRELDVTVRRLREYIKEDPVPKMSEAEREKRLEALKNFLK